MKPMFSLVSIAERFEPATLQALGNTENPVLEVCSMFVSRKTNTENFCRWFLRFDFTK